MMALAKKALSLMTLDGSSADDASRYRTARRGCPRRALPARRAGQPRVVADAASLVLAFLSVYPLSMLLYGSLHSTPPGMPAVSRWTATARSLTCRTADAAQYRRHLAGQDDPSLVLAVLLAWIWRGPTRRCAERWRC
jgi:iron(III) transport system permease protein